MQKITLLFLLTILINSLQAQLDMGGPPKKEKKKKKSEIVSPTKRKFSKVQKKYPKQIVFSNSKIKINEENSSEFITEWNLGDPLHLRAYYDQTLMEAVYDYEEKTGGKFDEYYFADFGTITVVYIDGKEMGSHELRAGTAGPAKDWVSHSGVIFDMNKKNYAQGSEAIAISNAFNALGKNFKVGSYKLKLEVYAIPSVIKGQPCDKESRQVLLTSGEINVKTTSSGMNTYNNFTCRHIFANEIALKDKELEKKIATFFTAKNSGPALDVTIIDSDWSIKKNSLGIPLYRYITAKIVYTNDKGNTELVTYQVKQEYTGGGSYSSSIDSKYFGEEQPYCTRCVDFKKDK